MWRVRALAIWQNVAILSALLPLACATPPDPTYIAGLWDNADYDDVVIFLTASTCLTDTHPPSAPVRRRVVVALVPSGEERLLPAASYSLHPPRPPPAV